MKILFLLTLLFGQDALNYLDIQDLEGIRYKHTPELDLDHFMHEETSEDWRMWGDCWGADRTSERQCQRISLV